MERFVMDVRSRLFEFARLKSQFGGGDGMLSGLGVSWLIRIVGQVHLTPPTPPCEGGEKMVSGGESWDRLTRPPAPPLLRGESNRWFAVAGWEAGKWRLG